MFTKTDAFTNEHTNSPVNPAKRRNSGKLCFTDKKDEQEKIKYVLEQLRTFFLEERDEGEKTENYALYNECLKKAHTDAELVYKEKQNKHILYVNDESVATETAAKEILKMIKSLAVANVPQKPTVSSSNSNPEPNLPKQPNPPLTPLVFGLATDTGKQSTVPLTLQDMLSIGYSNVKNCAGKDIVLVIGTTGTGKSTAIAYLMGAPLQQGFSKGGSKIVRLGKPEKESEYPKIGETVHSETLYPQTWLAENGEELCDSPGFFDNSKGLDRRVAISINTELAVKLARSVRVVALVSHSDLSCKASGFLEVTNLLSKLFVNPGKAVKSVLWVITKSHEQLMKEQVAYQLQDKDEGVLSVLYKQAINLKNSLEKVFKGWAHSDPTKAFEGIKGFYDAVSSQKGVRDEAEDLVRQQEVVQGITTNNLFILKLFSGGKLNLSGKNELLSKMKDLPHISSSEFDFDAYDEARITFRKLEDDVMYEAIELFNKKKKLQDEKAQCDSEISTTNEKIKLYEQGKGSDEKSVLNHIQSHDKTSTAEEIKQLEEKNKKNNEEIKKLQGLCDPLKGKEEVLIYKHNINKHAPLTWLEEKFGYEGAIITRADETWDKKKGKLTSMRNGGKYQATYVGNWLQEAEIEVTLYSEERHIPSNQMLLTTYSESIEKLEKDNKKTIKDIEELRKESTKLSSTELTLAQVDEKLEKLTNKKNQKQSELTKKKEELSIVEKKIEGQKSSLEMFYNLLSLSLSKSKLAEEFQLLYKLHKESKENPPPQPEFMNVMQPSPQINLAYQYEDNDIQAILCARLQKFPAEKASRIELLAAVDNVTNSQLENRLKEEKETHQGARITLIPCNLGNAHWVGMLLEFEANGQVKRAEYIDSLTSDITVPETFKIQLQKVYPTAHFEERTSLKQSDGTSCGAYTIENLLIAAGLVSDTQSLETALEIRNSHLETLKQYNPSFYDAFNKRQRENRPTTATLQEQLVYLDKLKNIWFSKQELNRILGIKNCFSKFPEETQTALLQAFEYKPVDDNLSLHYKKIREVLQAEIAKGESKALVELMELLFEAWQPGVSLDELNFRVSYNEILAITQRHLVSERIHDLQKTLEKQMMKDQEFAKKLQAELWSRDEALNKSLPVTPSVKSVNQAAEALIVVVQDKSNFGSDRMQACEKLLKIPEYAKQGGEALIAFSQDESTFGSDRMQAQAILLKMLGHSNEAESTLNEMSDLQTNPPVVMHLGNQPSTEQQSSPMLTQFNQSTLRPVPTIGNAAKNTGTARHGV